VLVDDGDKNAPPQPPAAPVAAEPPPPPEPEPAADDGDIGDEIQRILAAYSQNRKPTGR